MENINQQAFKNILDIVMNDREITELLIGSTKKIKQIKASLAEERETLKKNFQKVLKIRTIKMIMLELSEFGIDDIDGKLITIFKQLRFDIDNNEFLLHNDKCWLCKDLFCFI